MRNFFEYLRETVWKSRLKTCFCVAPVHIGLILLAYLHVLIAILQIASLSSSVTLFWPVLAHVSSALNGEGEPPSSLCVLHPATDLVFTGILIAGLHRRDVVLLRVYLWYGMVSLFFVLVVYGLLVALINPIHCAMIVFNAIYQIYILLLVRSLKIEIELNINDENKYMYNKDQGVVIVRDVESPMPRPVILDGYRVLPALPAPEITTSITTLNDQRPESPLDSKYNTLNKSNTLRTNTLQYYRITPDSTDNTPRSATLPHQDTAIIHKQNNTPKIGAVQSLASPSNYKPLGSNTDTLKRELVNPSTTFATVSKGTLNDPNDTKPVDSKKSEDKTKSDNAKENEGKDENTETIKKKRGIFKKAPKEKASKKDIDDIPVQSVCEASTSKSDEVESAADMKKETINSSKTGTSASTINKNVNINAADDENYDKKEEETAPKKKRGLFSKQPKEQKSEKKTKK